MHTENSVQANLQISSEIPGFKVTNMETENYTINSNSQIQNRHTPHQNLQCLHFFNHKP